MAPGPEARVSAEWVCGARSSGFGGQVQWLRGPGSEGSGGQGPRARYGGSGALGTVAPWTWVWGPRYGGSAGRSGARYRGSGALVGGSAGGAEQGRGRVHRGQAVLDLGVGDGAVLLPEVQAQLALVAEVQVAFLTLQRRHGGNTLAVIRRAFILKVNQISSWGN